MSDVTEVWSLDGAKLLLSGALVGGIRIGCFCTGHYVRFWVLATFATCVGHLEFNIRNMASKVLGINLDDQWVVE